MTAEAAHCRMHRIQQSLLEAVAYLPLVQLYELWRAVSRSFRKAAHIPCNGAILERMRELPCSKHAMQAVVYPSALAGKVQSCILHVLWL